MMFYRAFARKLPGSNKIDSVFSIGDAKDHCLVSHRCSAMHHTVAALGAIQAQH